MITKKMLAAVAITAAVLFSACEDEEIVKPVSLSKQTIVAEMAEPVADQQSRTCVDVINPSTDFAGLLWEVSDKLGVFSQNGKENALFSNTATKNTPQTEFGGEMSGTALYAYFPYRAENDGREVTDLKGKIFTEQPFDIESGSLICDYKIGKRAADGSNKFTFEQLFTLLRITLDASGTALEGERLNHITLKVTDKDDNERPICGDFTFDATTGNLLSVSNASNSVCMPWTNRPALAKNHTLEGFISVMPGVLKGDKLTVEIVTEGHKVTFTAVCVTDMLKGFVYNIPLLLKELFGKYDVQVEPIVQPTIETFKFDVANNKGKLLDNKLEWNSSKHTPSFSGVSTYTANVYNDKNEISLTIPYLYDFKLKPTFTVSADNSKVLVNGVEQASGETEVDFTKPVTYTVVTANGASRDYTVKVTNTGLPVVVVKHSTSGSFSKVTQGGFLGIGATTVNQFVDFMIRGKDTDWVEDDQITVYNADGTLDCDVAGGVRLRGNTTQVYPKKPFAIKLKSKTSVLGMPKHKRWVLLANWLDHSMIRNSVAFEIAHAVENAWRENNTIEQGIPWNVHGKHVELIVVDKDNDAHHVGNYFLCEQIKIDENRLNIKDSYEDVLSDNIADCGYLLEMDSKEDEDTKYTTSNGVPVKFKDDKIKGTAVYTAVSDKIQDIEDYLDAENYTEAYKLLDINSVIDQMLIWELTMNREYGDPGSVYMYMDGDGKLCAGPVWDFDRGTFQNQDKATSLGNSTSYRVKPDDAWMYLRSQESEDYSYIWYRQLAQDTTFQQTVQQRWKVIKPYLNMIVEQIRYYGQTQAVSYSYDSAMWPTQKGDITKYKSDFKDWSGDEEISGWNELIENFVTVYQERLDGMDALITSGKFTK